jgi:hypothetical protein
MKKYFTALLLFVIPMLSLYGCEKQKESSAEREFDSLSPLHPLQSLM